MFVVWSEKVGVVVGVVVADNVVGAGSVVVEVDDDRWLVLVVLC